MQPVKSVQKSQYNFYEILKAEKVYRNTNTFFKKKVGPQRSNGNAAHYQNLLEKVPGLPRPPKKAGPQTVTKSPINGNVAS